jgi:hypothetical protein
MTGKDSEDLQLLVRPKNQCPKEKAELKKSHGIRSKLRANVFLT